MTRSQISPSHEAAPLPLYRRERAPLDALRLDSNEGSRTRWREYPDTTAFATLLAERWKVDPDRVLVTAGGDELIDRICRAYLSPGRRLLMPIPSFEMIARYAVLAGAEVDTVWWDGAFPTAELISRGGSDVGVVAIVTPNNPTGAVASLSDLREVSQAFPDAVVLLDHAYAEYAEEDFTDAALELPNVVVLRTLSKAWGLAGCRIGYGLGPSSILTRLRAAGGPYAVAAPALTAAEERLRTGEREMRAHVQEVRRERSALCARVAEWGFIIPASEANFVYLSTGARTLFLHEALRSLGIVARRLGPSSWQPEALRITLPGDDGEFATLTAALRTVLDPEALLLDMDGVLADVTGSQIECIRRTAAHFGVPVDIADIEGAQRAGNANDDWTLTRSLLCQGGVEVPREQVVACYQWFYRGSVGKPGLIDQEPLLIPAPLLRQLATTLPLAIITGRPREEAEIFLDRHGISDCFTMMVCREDGPLKPSPIPVQRACQMLGITRAILVGDTPDDMAAARAAGVLAVGFCLTTPDRGDTLLDEGAALVLTDARELREMIP